MEMTVQVPFQQILALVKTLTPNQKAKLRHELNEVAVKAKQDDFMEMLLNGPVYSDQDITIIEENRKSIAAWRQLH